MLDKKEFQSIQKDLQRFEEELEKLIQQCRMLIQLSKKVIYALHRGDKKAADESLKPMIKHAKNLPPKSYDTGLWSTALQEYVEAMCFYEFLVNNKMPSRKSLGVETHEYLLGLCDFSGELVRHTVQCVLKKDYATAKRIRDIVDELYWQFLQFDLRNGELRKKSDGIKHNLRRIEEVLYDVEIKLNK